MSRVLSTEEAKSAIRQLQSIISGGFTDQITQLDNQGRVLSDANNWDGPLAQQFRSTTWPETKAALDKARTALEGQHFLAADVSDARAVFTLEGPGIRDMLAKLCPADLSPDALPTGEFRRSHLGQVAAAFWLESESKATVVCFRSVAQYMFDLLSKAAEPGSELGYFAPTAS